MTNSNADDKDARVIFSWAKALIEDHDDEGATEILVRLTRSDLTEPRVLYDIALILVDRHQCYLGRRLLEHNLRCFPSHSMSFDLLCDLYLWRGRVCYRAEKNVFV